MAPYPTPFARLRAALPTGKTLPPEIWQRRHRAMTMLVWAHAGGLYILGVARGYPLWHMGHATTPIVCSAVPAGLHRHSRRFRACMVSLGLLTSSAVLVHLTG